MSTLNKLLAIFFIRLCIRCRVACRGGGNVLCLLVGDVRGWNVQGGMSVSRVSAAWQYHGIRGEFYDVTLHASGIGKHTARRHNRQRYAAYTCRQTHRQDTETDRQTDRQAHRQQQQQQQRWGLCQQQLLSRCNVAIDIISVTWRFPTQTRSRGGASDQHERLDQWSPSDSNLNDSR